MTEQEAAAASAADEASANPTPEADSGQVTAQADVQPEAVESEEEKQSASKRRREERKAQAERLRQERDAALQRAQEAEARAERLARPAPTERDNPDPLGLEVERAIHKRDMLQVEDVKAEADASRKAAMEAEAKSLQVKAEAYMDAVAEVRASGKYADLDSALEVAKRPDVLSQPVSLMVLDADNPVDLAYHLGKNPALAREISRLPPLAAARRLGQIEASIKAPTPKTQSSAPPPISPVKPSAPTVRSTDDMSHAEYRKFREAGGVPIR